jgi:hypothetical protein
MEEELKHHTRGMSKWPAILACACYEGTEGGKNAEFGTEKHAYLAAQLAYLRDNGALPPRDEAADFFDAGCRRVAERIRDSLIANNVQPSAMHIEERCTMEDGTYGTADLWFCNEETSRLFVWDFKTFRNPGRDYTAQLAGYALAINQTRELEGKLPLHETNLRVAYGDSAEVDCVMLSLAELQDITAEAMAAFDAADKGEAQPTQCNWCELCANASTCPAFKAVAETVTKPIYASIPAQWETLPMERKAQMLVLAETVVKWADAVREKAKADLMGGATIEDEENGIKYCLRSVSGRKTPRTADACKMLMGKGVSADEIRGELTMSAASVKKLLKAAGLKGKAIDEALSAVCDVTAGSVQMVRG